MTAYYNENNSYAAQWLRNLIAAGHIAPGDVDERSIVDVRADDLRRYTQCHFFAGIGGWSVALRLADWPDDRPVWTGSCPCQPFSAAGAGKAADDERHLWPAWFPLIAECRPAIVFGEQVEAAIGWGWLDTVFADLEGQGYACGATILPACSVGAPHIRQRCWFVADNSESGRQSWGRTSEASAWRDAARIESGRLRNAGELADAERGAAERRGHDLAEEASRAQGETRERQWLRTDVGSSGVARIVADADGGDPSEEGLQRCGEHGQQAQDGRALRMGDSNGAGPQERERNGRIQREAMEPRAGQAAIGASNAGIMAVAKGEQFNGSGDARRRRGEPSNGSPLVNTSGEQAGLPGRARESGTTFWSDAEWIACTDGKSRPVRPGSFPLAHGIRHRTSKLRAYGNAINPQTCAEFIVAASEALDEITDRTLTEQVSQQSPLSHESNLKP